MRSFSKRTILGFLTSIVVIVNGLVDREIANPSPHGYVEIFVSLPQVLLGGLMLIGSILSILKVRWIRITGLVVQAISVTGLALFYAFYFWALLGP